MTNQLTDMKHADVIMICGGNPAENHPASMKHVSEARRRGCKIIAVDPRFSRSAQIADMWLPIRPGTDIMYLGALVNYILENKLYNEEYVVKYTNASYLINPEFSFSDGMFSGFKEHEATAENRLGHGRSGHYDKGTWSYQVQEEKTWDTAAGAPYEWAADPKIPAFEYPKHVVAKTDPTLQDPHCVFQLMKNHFKRYTPEMVERVCGIKQDLFLESAQLMASSGAKDKVAGFMYAMGLCQHTVGAESIRTACIMQLLLGNVGQPGGGVNAMRGESNVQGATDFALLAGELPGYLKLPNIGRGEFTFGEYLTKRTTPNGYWTNYPKFMVSMLREWFDTHATLENNFCFDLLPKDTALDHTHISIFERIGEGKIKGFFAWGENPAVGGPNTVYERECLGKLDFLVCTDLWETDTAQFWKAPGVDPTQIGTEVFFLPACCHYEKEGTLTNTGRVISWRYKAVEPLEGAYEDGDLLLWLHDALVKEAQKNPCPHEDGQNQLLWMHFDSYRNEHGHYDSHRIAKRINGYEVESGKMLKSFATLKADGSTLCANWIYAGYYNNGDALDDPSKQPCGRRDTTDVTAKGGNDGLGLYPNWSFAWPVNRRILYNRASCDFEGKPWRPGRQLVEYDQKNAKWISYDVPDFAATTTPDKCVPFMMTGETVSRLFSPAMADGPFPEHYEPIESPVKNKMSNTQVNPVALCYFDSSKTREQKPEKYPITCSSFHLVEHWQSGDATRNKPWLVEVMPKMFVEVPQELADERGFKNGDMVEVFNERGSIRMHAMVTKRMRPYVLDGETHYAISMPFHWGYSSKVTSGAIANDISPNYGDANASTPESKAFLCDIRKVGE